MIESIEIKNFRCFKDTKIAKFAQVNLFGGLNNAGKTALLESLYLSESPNISSIMFLHRTIRKEEVAFIKEMPSNTWNNLFFQQNKNEVILLSSFKKEGKVSQLTVSCDEEVESLINFIDDLEDDNEINQIHSALSEKDAIKSALHLKVCKNNKEEYLSILVASKSGIITQSSSGIKIDNAKFIPASAKLSTSSLAKEYDKVRFNPDMDEKILLKAFQIIDQTIEKVDVFSIGKPALYLQRKNEKRMPVSLFGDAINKIADFILRIINNPNSIVLIDEVENGIHFTNQEKLWKMLFDLAIEYKVQIFATTHSLEMIKAFSSVAQEFPEKAAYFEMVRSQKTHKIKAIKHNFDTLNFELERNIGIRGDS